MRGAPASGRSPSLAQRELDQAELTLFRAQARESAERPRARGEISPDGAKLA